jgi:hypothetical protein
MTITYSGGTYELVIDNVGSVELADAADVVTTLANAMAAGLEEVVSLSEFIFAGGLPESQIVGLFSSVDSLFLEQALVFDAAAIGETILSTLAEAGEALLLLL